MRLIDADALEMFLADNYGYPVIDILGDIAKSPTVDAVKVVRCKDCKHWWKKNEVCAHPKCCDSFLMVVEAPPEHFCGYGERKRR